MRLAARWRYPRLAATAVLASLVLTSSVLVVAPPAVAAGLVEVTGFGSNPGNLRMFSYVPDGLPVGQPLVVALHGCTQSAAAYDDETGWAKYADQWQFALLLPQQQGSNNGFSCFNWFEPGDIARGQGEALSIKQMVDQMLTDHGSDSTRVYVTGLSSGGAMTAVMMAAYPDVFRAGASVGGVPYRCATSSGEVNGCMNPGVDRTPQAWGDLVRAAFPSWSGPWPHLSIWHGDSDTTVSPTNLTELMEQWTNVHGADQTPDVQDTVQGYPHKLYRDPAGAPVVETYMVTGMGHGQPIDPGPAQEQCGVVGAWVLDVDVCAAYHIGRFWLLDDSDSQAPTVTITSPTDGATVSGPVTIQATAADDVGVASVEFLVDGKLMATDTTAPFAAEWNTSVESNGSHTLLARAHDAAGNTGTSTSISVTVTGGVEDTTAPTVDLTFPADGDTVSGTITMAAAATDDLGVSTVEFFVDGASVGTGTPSGQAGPWTLAWNTTSVADGAHALMVKAYDAAGNVGIDDDTTVIVDQDTPAVEETFSDRDASGDHFDLVGWSSGGYSASTDNHTAAQSGTSSSTLGYASSGTSCQTGLRTETLSRTVTLPDNPRLTYWRKLDLQAQVNLSTTAAFTVRVDGTVVDQEAVTYANHVESAWTERADIDLAAFANQTVTLAFEVAANSNVCIEAWAKAWLDDIRIASPGSSSDVTAPMVDVTAPSNGATVSGTVDITATATDDVDVAKVEFYIDGMLLEADTTEPHGVTWQTSTLPNGTHRIMAKAYDAAGNVGTDDDTEVTVSNTGGGTVTVTFDNQDANDGYVKANADGSGAEVGTLESLYGLALGRGTDAKLNRTVLSFDTSALPDTATIQRAWLTVSHNSASGDAWADPTGNELVIDVKTGCFGTCTIEASDWGDPATAAGVSSLLKWTSGTTSSTEFSSDGLAALDTTGTTQLRLRFELDQTATNYLFIGHGTTAQLHVEHS